MALDWEANMSPEQRSEAIGLNDILFQVYCVSRSEGADHASAMKAAWAYDEVLRNG